MKKAEAVKYELDKIFPNPKCELEFGSVFQMLVAVILSAQCTDKRVNQVTKKLFNEYSTPEDFAVLTAEELEPKIFSCGFYHNKAKAIINASRQILERFDGQVPSTLEELESLAGVGRKTARVVYSLAFSGDAIAVDTHVFRVSNRLGLCSTNDVVKCEKALENLFNKSDWSKLHYQLVLFGRYICKAKKPDCENCPLQKECDYYKKLEK